MALPLIKHPISTCTLPDSKTVIKYRPFLRGEEKILLIAKESEEDGEIEDAIYQVIEQCTSGQIKRNTRLSSIDLEYLFIKLRIASKGNTTTVGLKCRAHVDRPELIHPVHGKIPAFSGECSKVNEVVINLTDIIAHVPDKSEATIELGDGIGLVMRFPDAEMLKKHKSLKTEADVLAIMFDCVDTIYDAENVYSVDELENKAEELGAFFDQFNDEQSAKIVKFFHDMPKLQLNVDFKCVSCGHAESITLSGMQDFF